MFIIKDKLKINNDPEECSLTLDDCRPIAIISPLFKFIEQLLDLRIYCL